MADKLIEFDWVGPNFEELKVAPYGPKSVASWPIRRVKKEFENEIAGGWLHHGHTNLDEFGWYLVWREIDE